MTTPIENITTSPADTLGGGLARLFGEGARLVEQPAIVDNPLSLTDNAVVWLMVVAMFVYYLFVVFAYGGYVGQMWKIVVGDNIGIRVADELSYLFMRAVRNSVALGIITWALVVVGWLDIFGVESLGGLNSLWLVPIGIATFAVVGAVQRVLTIGVCTLVRREEVAQGLNILADTLMALASIVVTPVALLFVINSGASAQVLGYVAIGVAVVAFATFVTKSLIFFIEQKVSILLWILYLCAVVLIPIGIVATLVVRNSAI